MGLGMFGLRGQLAIDVRRPRAVDPRRRVDTNVRKLFLAASNAKIDPNRPQFTYYLPGVGTDIRKRSEGFTDSLPDPRISNVGNAEIPWRRMAFGGTAGYGTKERIKEAYAFLCANYAKGDRVYVFGFSRGAYAARSLVNFISKVGILLRHQLNAVEAAYRIYEAGDADELGAFIRSHNINSLIDSPQDERAIIIHLLGVWDTVGAMGLPGRTRCYEARHTEFAAKHLPPNVMAARHALALHELRSLFEPMLWEDINDHPSLRQVWFAGAHADVGGGYTPFESGLSNGALNWMAHEAWDHKLLIDWNFIPKDSWRKTLSGASTPKCIVHHQIRGPFALCTPRPRRFLVELASAPSRQLQGMRCHESLVDFLSSSSASNFPYTKRINETLLYINELATQGFLVGRLRASQGQPAPASRSVGAASRSWLKQITPKETGSAAKTVESFIDADSAPDASQLNDFGRALALRVLLFNSAEGSILVLQAATAMSRLDPVCPELFYNDVDLKAFNACVERCRSIAEGLLVCSDWLHREGFKDMADAMEASAERLSRITLEYKQLYSGSGAWRKRAAHRVAPVEELVASEVRALDALRKEGQFMA